MLGKYWPEDERMKRGGGVYTIDDFSNMYNLNT
jgi:hypothetical protein